MMSLKQMHYEVGDFGNISIDRLFYNLLNMYVAVQASKLLFRKGNKFPERQNILQRFTDMGRFTAPLIGC